MKEKTQLDQKQLTLFDQLNTNNHRASSGALFLYYPTKHYPPVLYLSLSTAFKIDSIAYSQPHFYIPQRTPLFPCFPSIFHHFSPLLSIHLFHCGKCGKFCGKPAILAYKYSISWLKIPVNTPKSYLGYLLYVFLRLVFEYVVPLIYWEPMVPRPSFPEKTFSLFSSSPHFVRVAVKLFFFFRT